MIREKIRNLNNDIVIIEPSFEIVTNKQIEFDIQCSELQERMVNEGVFKRYQIDTRKVDVEFSKINKEYIAFRVEYLEVTKKYKFLVEQLENYLALQDNILMYRDKIVNYFDGK